MLIESPQNRMVFKRINELKSRSDRWVRRSLALIGRESSRHLKQLIKNPPHTGRIYKRRGNLGAFHQASAPGEAPADMTGDLRASVGYKVTGYDEVVIGEEERYAPYLEYGWKDKRLLPRPHVMRMGREREGQNRRIFRDSIKRALKGR